MPALVDDLSETSRRDLGAEVTRNLQIVAGAATGAVARESVWRTSKLAERTSTYRVRE